MSALRVSDCWIACARQQLPSRLGLTSVALCCSAPWPTRHGSCPIPTWIWPFRVQAQDYWRAWRLVEDVIADHPVDLIDMDTATDSLLRAIERHGVEL